MIKQPYTNPLLRETVEALSPDTLEIFLLGNGSIRGSIFHGTRMINEMRLNHQLGILETLILGHAYLGVGLLTAMVKGLDRIVLSIECGGPVQGLSVEANAEGNIRGYLKNSNIDVTAPLENFDTSDFFGPGFISVARHIQGAKQPFTGQTILHHGNIAQDLASHFNESEQIPTSFSLSVKFNSDGDAVGAGGLFLQVLPGAGYDKLEALEKIVYAMPSFGEFFSKGGSPADLLEKYFKAHSPEIIGDRNARFFCTCSKERFQSYLASLPPDEKTDILEEGPFPLITTCHNCNTDYNFSKAELQAIYSN
jgi:molecular chaperone Hsp33